LTEPGAKAAGASDRRDAGSDIEVDLAALRRGDRREFRRVYDAYVGLVAHVATRCGMQKEERDEIVQETFLKLYERGGEVREAKALKAWLAVTARNLALDRIRRRARRRTDAVGADLDALAPAGEDALDSARRELELELVRELLDKIAAAPGGETLKLFYADGLTAKEIAARNGEAISTVTTRLSRLRQRFQAELAAHVEALRSRLA
jgi:RNA polymerase sigma-70 factor (ECF subfamily)